MVQVLQPRERQPRKSGVESFFTGALSAAPDAFKQYQSQRETGRKSQDAVEQEHMKRLYEESKQRQQHEYALDLEQFKQSGKQQQNQQDLSQNLKTYDTIKKYYGQEAADIYEASPEGGKTRIMDALLTGGQREMTPARSLGIKEVESSNFAENNSSISNEKKPDKSIDYDKGLTPAERTRRQENRYSKNLPLYQESNNKMFTYENDREAYGILEELSPQIQGIERLNINPTTGELVIPALASKEAQRYVKTINDFTVRAKDSFGSRVTNFDLDRFMKRLPSLANSEEGRKEIIEQMKIINAINIAHEKSIQEVIDEHGGIRNIDYDEAERLAGKRSKKEIENLRSKFKTIDAKLDKQEEMVVKDYKKITPKGKVAVKRKDGSTGYIDKEKLNKFLEDGAGEAL